MNSLTLWNRTQQCGPITSCCSMYWSIGAGETLPLQIDWQGFLASVPGYSLNAIESVELVDLMKNPPGPADEDAIALVSGLATDPETHLPGFGQIIDAKATEFLIRASADIAASSCYRLDVCLGLVNCNGRRLQVCDCVNIQVSRWG